MRIKILTLFAIVLLLQSCQKDTETVQTSTENKTANFDSKIIDVWTNMYLTIEKDLPGFRPAATCRALGYINMAAYETCLPGMPNYVSNKTHLPNLNLPVLQYDVSEINWNVALNTCYATTLKYFMTNLTNEQKALIYKTELDQRLELRDKMFNDVFQNSINWGTQMANAIIEYADSDPQGYSQSLNAFPNDYVRPTGLGLWEPPSPSGKALFPFWGKVRTFAAQQSDLIGVEPLQYSSSPSSEYYKQHLELYNQVTNITYEERWKAEFWSDDIVGLTFSPPARLFALGLQVMSLEKMNLEESLYFFCKLGIAVNDGAVAAWNSKYIYNTERPETFIRKYIDPQFKSILGEAVGTPGLVPPFPGYPSGHSTFGGIMAEIFTEFFGANYKFTDYCHDGRTEFLSTPRTFNTWKQMGEENAYSRIPLGVHIKMDCDEGLRMGKLIAKRAIEYELKVN